MPKSRRARGTFTAEALDDDDDDDGALLLFFGTFFLVGRCCCGFVRWMRCFLFGGVESAVSAVLVRTDCESVGKGRG